VEQSKSDDFITLEEEKIMMDNLISLVEMERIFEKEDSGMGTMIVK
jgi:hypothetical protein